VTSETPRDRKRFPRSARLTKALEYQSVYNAQVHSADKMLVVNGAPNGLDRTRLGLSISRRVGNAVLRNRWKRLIREAFRLHRHELPTGIDLVVRPRKGARPDFEAICASLPRHAARLFNKLRREQDSQDHQPNKEEEGGRGTRE